MSLVPCTFNEDVEIWQNPEEKDDVYTVGDIFRYEELRTAVQRYLSELEDGTSNVQQELENLIEVAESQNCGAWPCPLCGRYSAHSHTME